MPDSRGRGSGQPKGTSQAWPGAPRQGVFVAKADELKGIMAVDEYFVRAPQQPGGARGSGTRSNPVGAGGSGRGQATFPLLTLSHQQ